MAAIGSPDWGAAEDFVRGCFRGLRRKNGEAMEAHSLRMGRRARSLGLDPVTVFGAYAHDVLEDTPAGEDDVFAAALAALGGNPAAAEAAALLVREASYSESEKLLPKAERKRAACARWAASEDGRLLAVKALDVDDNAADAVSVSAEFVDSYMGWAGPLREALRARLPPPLGTAAETAPAPAPPAGR